VERKELTSGAKARPLRKLGGTTEVVPFPCSSERDGSRDRGWSRVQLLRCYGASEDAPWYEPERLSAA